MAPERPNSHKRGGGAAAVDPKLRKRAKMHEARNISTQTSGRAFANGEVDVQRFVKAREFEIEALQTGLKQAKNFLSTRAFQEVPRDMRRRTASHNSKRVPKRLRPRAVREMKEDNTTAKKEKKRKMDARMRKRMDGRIKAAYNVAKLKKGSQKKGNDEDVEMEDTTDLNGKPQHEQNSDTRMSDIDTDIELPGSGPKKNQNKDKTKSKPSKKGVLQHPDLPASEFRKRQIHKTWLPTHLFHAKRARMTAPDSPLWGFSLPLTPSAKCYRATHRASLEDGAVAWDVSYMSTIALEGEEKQILALFRQMSVTVASASVYLGYPYERELQEWADGKTPWKGWMNETGRGKNVAPKPLAPVTIIWQPLSMKSKDRAEADSRTRQVFIRVHPSVFLDVWEKITTFAANSNPPVSVRDARYEIGSIEITGPQALAAVARILKPWKREDQVAVDKSPSEMEADGVWAKFRDGSIELQKKEFAKSLAFGFDALDPRLHIPSRSLEDPVTVKWTKPSYLKDWRNFRPQPYGIFDSQTRKAASTSLLTQKKIDGRRSKAMPGVELDILPQDSRIPVLVFPTIDQKAADGFDHNPGRDACFGSWTILLPWKFVDPVWRCLMKIRMPPTQPGKQGQMVRFGGLKEQRQMCFEMGKPWFPGDVPGTTAGDAWAVRERMENWEEWNRKPKGRRIEWDSLDLKNGEPKGEIGAGWACDWDVFVPELETEYAKSGYNPGPVVVQHVQGIYGYIHCMELQPRQRDCPGLGITPVLIKYVTRGVPKPTDRIYRLPFDKILRDRWLKLVKPPTDDDDHDPFSGRLAGDIRPSPKFLQPGDPDYPPVPGKEDLIGFVTSGNYNLRHGFGTGIGSIIVRKVIPKWARQPDSNKKLGHNYCIVRESGQQFGKLAKWYMTKPWFQG